MNVWVRIEWWLPLLSIQTFLIMCTVIYQLLTIQFFVVNFAPRLPLPLLQSLYLSSHRYPLSIPYLLISLLPPPSILLFHLSLRSSSLLSSFEDDVIQLVKSSKDQGAARLALTSNEYGLSLDQVSTCNTNRFLNFLSFLPSFLPSFTPRLCFFLSCFLAFLLSFFLFFLPSFFPSFLFSFLLSFLSSLFYLSSFFLPSFFGFLPSFLPLQRLLPSLLTYLLPWPLFCSFLGFIASF